MENDMESVPEGGRRGTERAEPWGVEAVTARRGGEMEPVRSGINTASSHIGQYDTG